jgi:quaternary ammonium compound-resistance protein SugE
MLLVAGIFEIFMALGLKYSEGFSKLWPSVITLGFAILSFYTLSQSIKVIPIGTAYAIWTGIGAAGIATIGILLFNETASFIRIFYIFLIIIAVIGLKLTERC